MAQRIDINIDETELRDALGRFATGVTVVTAQGPAGQLLGMTANAFCSVSLDPPLILVCVNYEAAIYPAIRDRKTFCVNLLNENQGTIAYEFADRDLDMTDRVQWRFSDRGNPLLQDFQALFECRLEHEYPGGDHAIVVGRVQALEIRNDAGPPLLYFRGKFGIDPQ